MRLAGAAVVHGGNAPLMCECIDLAIGGVGLKSPTKIKKGTRVGVVLSLHDRSVSLTATVKRCRAQNRQWVLGLQFAAVDPESAAVLEGFLEGAMHRDVRLYQAQVFLARAGARSLEEILGTKGALGGALEGAQRAGKGKESVVVPEPVSEEVEGSAPIALDEPGQARTPTHPWAPVPPPPGPAQAVPETSADLRHAVATALHDFQHELSGAPVAEPSWPAAPKDDPWARGDFGDAPPKGGTMIRRDPLVDAELAIPARTGATMPPPSAVVTSPGLRVPQTIAPPEHAEPAAGFATDVSALEYDDAPGSDGRPGRRTTVVDPRALAERSAGVRPPPLRVERAASEAASFQPRIADLDLDDAPTRMFGDAPQRFDTPPSPFGGGRARSVVPPPSATSTLVNVQASVDAPTPIPIPGRDEMRTPAATPQTGATQVAIPAARTMPYGPVRGESTQVAISAHGRPSPRPPSPFGRHVAQERHGPAAHDPQSEHALDEAATRLRAHPVRDSGASADAARTDAEDAELAAQYGRALTDLDLESR